MKILHVIADLDRRRGGPAQVCIELARLLANAGHDVRIVTTERGFPAEFVDHGPEPFGPKSLTIESFPIDPPRFWGTSWAMRRRLSTAVQEADIVHVHSLYMFHDWVTGHYCRLYNKAYIVRPHGTLDPYMHNRHRWRKYVVERLFQNEMQRRAAGLHYTTQEEWDLARPYAHNPRGWVAPNGIDLSQFDNLPPSGALRLRYPQIGDRRVVLFFGRLNFKKGVDTTISMFANVARKRSDVILVIAGPDGGMRRLAEQRVGEASLADRVIFTGMVTGEDKRIVLGGSDFFVLPSMSENFGISVVEAAACGIPVIFSDRVNLRHDFEAAKAGLIAPPNAAAFAECLCYLLDNPAECSAMARRGYDFVRRRYTWDALAGDYEKMYREAINFHGVANLFADGLKR
jgi:glycosyltransferase involved in cell wall biosynthesis